MAMCFSDVIPALAKSKDLHSRFINTLSYLEYVGARKILKSQDESSISMELLAHIAEEVRHAQVLKKIALKMSDHRLPTYADDQLLAGAEARAYIQAVDRSSEKENSSFKNYLYTTLLLEERAKKIYPFYEPILAEAGFPGALRAIVLEEESHLHQISKHLSTSQNAPSDIILNEMRQNEEAAFSRWMHAISLILLKV